MVLPGYVQCSGCGRVITYQVGSAKDEMEVEAEENGSGSRLTAAGPHEGSGRRVTSAGSSSQAEEPPRPARLKLSQEGRETLYGSSQAAHPVWRIVKQNLQRCERYHNEVR